MIESIVSTGDAVLDKNSLPPRQSIGWFDGKVRFIDQRRLPHEWQVVETDNWETIERAIKTLAVRGAPLIGVSAAYGVAATSVKFKNETNYKQKISGVIDSLLKARPTAVNLVWALTRMRKIVENETGDEALNLNLIREAIDIHEDDKQRCAALADYGQEIVQDKSGIITICNTGFLATGGAGTAAAIFYEAHDSGKDLQVYACETRPLLQGARLTVWEMTNAGVPVTLLVDSASASLAASGKADLCIIGADRIAANGDSANKIGSYTLALVCSAHKIPFYVAAPFSTIDIDCPDGNKIPVEQRDGLEVTHIEGVEIAAKNAKIFNPAFDVVPADLITGIITEKGIFFPPYRFKD